MSIVVDTYGLGPLQTNCHVVRVGRGAPEAAVIDPGGDAANLRLELAGMGATCTGILITHGHFDHLGGVADLAEGTGAPVWMPEGERALLEQYPDFAPAGAPGRAVHARPSARRRRDDRGRRASPSSASPSPDTRRRTSPSTRTAACSAATCSSPARSAAPTCPGADWDTLLDSVRTLADRYPPETLVYPGHGPRTTLGDELARNPFLAELRA